MEWSNGPDLSSMESELLLDSSELEQVELSEASSGEAYTIILQQDYSMGHFQTYDDFITVGFHGLLIGFALASVIGLVTLAFNALLNILKKGGN